MGQSMSKKPFTLKPGYLVETDTVTSLEVITAPDENGDFDAWDMNGNRRTFNVSMVTTVDEMSEFITVFF